MIISSSFEEFLLLMVEHRQARCMAGRTSQVPRKKVELGGKCSFSGDLRLAHLAEWAKGTE